MRDRGKGKWRRFHRISYVCILHRIRILYRSKGKGHRRCWLGDGIDSIPCRTPDLAPGWIEERILRKMDYLEKWMIIWFTPHQTTTLPKLMSFQKHFFKSSSSLNLLCSIQVCPPTSSDDLCLSFCDILILECTVYRWPHRFYPYLYVSYFTSIELCCGAHFDICRGTFICGQICYNKLSHRALFIFCSTY